MICFSTPFDASSVDFLERLNVPCYKIASFENTDIPLLEKVAATGKPIIMSTGLASVSELEESVHTLRESGCSDLVLLKCTSTYPATPENSNLATIPHMRELFNCQVGLSDHTAGVGAAVASVVFGATVVEKHFTLSRSDGGVDADFSLEPSELKSLVVESERAWQAVGEIKYGSSHEEEGSKKFRRSVYFSQNVKKGDVLSEDNIRIIRPGYSLSPKYYKAILGRKVKQDVRKGQRIDWSILE